MALDEHDIKKINDMIGAGIKPVTESVATIAGTVKTMGDGIGRTITDTVTPLIAKAVEGFKTTPDPKAEKSKEGEAPEWFKAYQKAQEEALKPINDFVNGSKSEREAAAAKEAAKILIEKTLAEKKLGGIMNNTTLMSRLVGGAPKSADDVMKLVEIEKTYAASFGVKPEQFGADPAAEGAKQNGSKASDAAEKKTQLLERIKTQGKEMAANA